MVPVNDCFWPKAAVALKPSRMSELGQERTSSATPIYVRFWGQSRHSEGRPRCLLYPQERTFETNSFMSGFDTKRTFARCIAAMD